MPLPGEGTDNERYDPCEAISRVGVEKMAAGGLVLEAGGGGWCTGQSAISGEEGLWEDSGQGLAGHVAGFSP